jgi:hypothetical protein
MNSFRLLYWTLWLITQWEQPRPTTQTCFTSSLRPFPQASVLSLSIPKDIRTFSFLLKRLMYATSPRRLAIVYPNIGIQLSGPAWAHDTDKMTNNVTLSSSIARFSSTAQRRILREDRSLWRPQITTSSQSPFRQFYWNDHPSERPDHV